MYASVTHTFRIAVLWWLSLLQGGHQGPEGMFWEPGVRSERKDPVRALLHDVDPIPIPSPASGVTPASPVCPFLDPNCSASASLSHMLCCSILSWFL